MHRCGSGELVVQLGRRGVVVWDRNFAVEPGEVDTPKIDGAVIRDESRGRVDRYRDTPWVCKLEMCGLGEVSF